MCPYYKKIRDTYLTKIVDYWVITEHVEGKWVTDLSLICLNFVQQNILKALEEVGERLNEPIKLNN